MNARVVLLAAGAAALLAGCLEVEQHPGWRHGQYDGKPDNRPDQALFHGDRLAWWAAIDDRNRHQNEYNRTPEKGGPP